MIMRGSMMLGLLIVSSSMLMAQEPAERPPASAEARIAAAFERARSAGVPTSALQNRVAEGEAKGVGAQQIAAAVERRLEALLQARRIVGGGDDLHTELTAAAMALEAGVGPELVARIRAVAPEDRRTLAYIVLGSLVEQGVPADMALERVELALSGELGALQRLNAGPPAGAGAGFGAETSAAARARAGGIDAAAAARARGRAHVRPGGEI